jgi:U3 small nucleolar RNA-associated protein 14
VPSLPSGVADVETHTIKTLAPSFSKKIISSPLRLPAPEINPWLQKRESALKVLPQKNSVAVAKESKTSEKAKHKLKKKAPTREGEKAKLRDDATLEISTTDTLAVSTLASATAGSNKPHNSASPTANFSDQAGGDKDDSDAVSDVEEQLISEGSPESQRIRAFQQRDLVALAFAGDNVVQVCWAPVARAQHKTDQTFLGFSRDQAAGD